MGLRAIPSVWGENSPDSLLDIAARFCIRNCNVLRKSGLDTTLRDNVLLPEEICERMLMLCRTENEYERLHDLIRILKYVEHTRIRWVDLSQSDVADEDLTLLTHHCITNLNINNCRRLTSKSLWCIQQLSQHLQSLMVGTSAQVFTDDKISDPEDHHLSNHYMGLFHSRIDAPGETSTKSLELPMLKSLVVNGLLKAECNPNLMSLLKSARGLTHLDLSRCGLSVHFGQHLVQHTLTSLVLYDVASVKECIPTVCQIKTLSLLDISSSDIPITYDNPNQTLKMIVESLKNLTSLDISGTNLAGSRVLDFYPKEEGAIKSEILTDIPGLASRVNNPLQFLGLLNTAHEACYRHHIPAKKVSGDATEEQILTSGEAYIDREPLIQKALNDLFQMFRNSWCGNPKLALDIILQAMQRHLSSKHIQVSGSASLFYIVKSEYKHLFNIKIRRKIIKVLIDAMFSHYSDVTMLRNGCLTLIHFKIPEDVFFEYERLASLLLLVAGAEDQDEFVQRIAVYLLNSLACQVDGLEKRLVGERGAITIMLQVIMKRLQRNVCDEVMETAWSTMWNVTDETPVNCGRFLEGKGMDLFLACLQAFPERPELLRNMMGLLGNVAEVSELRSALMKDQYLSVFSNLLSNESDGIEVSYNAAGILSHIVADGAEAWDTHHISVVSRQQVLRQMAAAIGSWSLTTKRNINYRSFRPILRLLSSEGAEEAVLWGVWALANLTTVYPDKYCRLLQEEGGTELLSPLSTSKHPMIAQLARATLVNCTVFEKKETVSEGPNHIEDTDSDSDFT